MTAVERPQVVRAAELRAHIERVVDQAPPLTDEQRARLARILAPAGAA